MYPAAIDASCIAANAAEARALLNAETAVLISAVLCDNQDPRAETSASAQGPAPWTAHPTVQAYNKEYQSKFGRPAEFNSCIYASPIFDLVPHLDGKTRLHMSYWREADSRPYGQDVLSAINGEERLSSLVSARRKHGPDICERVSYLKLDNIAWNALKYEPWAQLQDNSIQICWLQNPPALPICDSYDDFLANPARRAKSAAAARFKFGIKCNEALLELPSFKSRKSIERHYGNLLNEPFFELNRNMELFQPRLRVLYSGDECGAGASQHKRKHHGERLGTAHTEAM